MATERIKVNGTAIRIKPDVHLASVLPDGSGARFLWFPLGMPEMDEEDYRQFEVTPQNAQKMVDLANGALAGGEEIWVNYGHNCFGPRAGVPVRFELAPEGVMGIVKWNDAARASIKQEPPEWSYFSPEFYASEITDQDGKPKLVNGRQVLQPNEICGGALTNVPAMVRLAVAASRGTTPTPSNHVSPSPASDRKELEMKVSPENMALLGLAADATEEQINAAVAAKLKAPPQSASVEAVTTATTDLVERIVSKRLEAEHKVKAAADAVEAAVRAGKVTVGQRDQALKLAAADFEAFSAFVANAPRVAPVAPVLDFGGNAPLEAGSYGGADLSDPNVNDQLIASAKALAAAEGITVFAAAERLTKKGA
jgi:hypothetical protein